MRLQPLRKTAHGVFKKCPWHADAIFNQGYEQVMSQQAADGIEVHNLWVQCLSGEMTLDEALVESSSEEVQELLKQSLECNLHSGYEQWFEQKAYVDSSGGLIFSGDNAIVSGTLDRIIRLSKWEVSVEDLKTGRWQTDPLYERHSYTGVLAKAIIPEAEVIRFSRVWCRTGERPEWVYQFGKNGVVTIDNPDGTTTTMQSENKNGNPLLDYVKSEIAIIEATDPVPTPGEHCQNWYGAPCQFLGDRCPLSADTPMIVDASVTKTPKNAELPLILRALADGEAVEMDTRTVSDAYTAVEHAEAYLKRIAEQIKAWSRVNGEFKQGDTRIGWFTTDENEVDKVYVLEEMINQGVPVEVMVKALNISKSSIEKLPKKTHSALRNLLLTFGVSKTGSRPKFGVIKG